MQKKVLKENGVSFFIIFNYLIFFTNRMQKKSLKSKVFHFSYFSSNYFSVFSTFSSFFLFTHFCFKFYISFYIQILFFMFSYSYRLKKVCLSLFFIHYIYLSIFFFWKKELKNVWEKKYARSLSQIKSEKRKYIFFK